MKGIGISKWPLAKDMPFVIRDDDLSYFTRPEMIEGLYSLPFEMGYKVSFATIPCHKGTNNPNVPPDQRGSGREMPIDANVDLCESISELIAKGMADIALHGWNHSVDMNAPRMHFDIQEKKMLPEIAGKEGIRALSEFYSERDATMDRMRRGKELLEGSFGIDVGVTVPPQEFVSREFYMAARSLGLSICSGIGKDNLKAIPLGDMNILELLRSFLLKRGDAPLSDRSWRISKVPFLTPAYRHYWNAFTDEDDSETNLQRAIQWVEAHRRDRSPFILLTHYWEYYHDWEKVVTQQFQRQYLYSLLESVDRIEGVWKCTLNELNEWLLGMRSISTRIGDDAISIRSEREMKGLTIQHPGSRLMGSIDEGIITEEGRTIVNVAPGGSIRLRFTRMDR